MQRILYALVAFISLVSINIRPSQAQHAGEDATAAVTPSGGAEVDATARDKTVMVEAGKSVDNVRVDYGRLILEGHVKNDVLAINSEVLVKPGATVGGYLVAIGGSVDNQADPKLVRVVLQNRDVLNAESGMLAVPVQPPSETVVVHATPSVPDRASSWSGQQLALLLLGLLGGLVLLLAAPRATQQMTGALALEPARCLVVGGIGALGMLFVAFTDGALMHSPLGLLWKPFGAVVAIVLLLALAAGWLCGMRFAGDLVARKLGRADSGSLYGRMALGLGAFFLVNLVLGGISRTLGTAGLLLEALVSLMGLGALLITGFGSDPNWLSARLHGQTPWYGPRRRT